MDTEKRMDIMRADPLSQEDFSNSLVINLTNGCNTWCKYCFQDSRFKGVDTIRLEHVRRVLEFFDAKQSSGERYLQLTGGEIFLHPDIFEIIQLALSFGYALRLQTNGMLFDGMDGQELRLLSSDDITVKVSLDGWDRRTHERYRAKGSFSKVITGIRTIREWNRNVGVKTVIHELNLPEIWRMLDMCLELNAQGWSYNILRPEGRAKEFPSSSIKEQDIIEKVLPCLSQRKYVHLLNGTRIILYYLIGSNRIVFPKQFYIDFDGGIFPNQECRPEERIGSIFGEDLSSQFDSIRLTNEISEIPSTTYDYIIKTLSFIGKD